MRPDEKLLDAIRRARKRREGVPGVYGTDEEIHRKLVSDHAIRQMAIADSLRARVESSGAPGSGVETPNAPPSMRRRHLGEPGQSPGWEPSPHDTLPPRRGFDGSPHDTPPPKLGFTGSQDKPPPFGGWVQGGAPRSFLNAPWASGLPNTPPPNLSEPHNQRPNTPTDGRSLGISGKDRLRQLQDNLAEKIQAYDDSRTPIGYPKYKPLQKPHGYESEDLTWLEGFQREFKKTRTALGGKNSNAGIRTLSDLGSGLLTPYILGRSQVPLEDWELRSRHDQYEKAHRAEWERGRAIAQDDQRSFERAYLDSVSKEEWLKSPEHIASLDRIREIKRVDALEAAKMAAFRGGVPPRFGHDTPPPSLGFTGSPDTPPPWLGSPDTLPPRTEDDPPAEAPATSDPPLVRAADGTITAESIKARVAARRARSEEKYSTAFTTNRDPHTGQAYQIGHDVKRRDVFDKEQAGRDANYFYDEAGARAAGHGPDGTGHWPSEFKRDGSPEMFGYGMPGHDGELYNYKTGKPATTDDVERNRRIGIAAIGLDKYEDHEREVGERGGYAVGRQQGTEFVKTSVNGVNYNEERIKAKSTLRSAGDAARSMSPSQIVDLNNRLAMIDKQFPGITKDHYTAKDLMLKSRGPYRQHFRDPITGLPRHVSHPNEPFEALAKLNQAAASRQEARNMAIEGYRTEEIQDHSTNSAIARMFPGIDTSELKGLDPSSRMKAAQYLYQEKQDKNALDKAEEELAARKAHAKNTLPSWAYSAIEAITDPNQYDNAYREALGQVKANTELEKTEAQAAGDASAADDLEIDLTNETGLDSRQGIEAAIADHVKALGLLRTGSPSAGARHTAIRGLRTQLKVLDDKEVSDAKDQKDSFSKRVKGLTEQARAALADLRDATLLVPKSDDEDDAASGILASAVAAMARGEGSSKTSGTSVEAIDKKVAMIMSALKTAKNSILQIDGTDIDVEFEKILAKFEGGSQGITSGEFEESEWLRAKGNEDDFNNFKKDVSDQPNKLQGLFTLEGIGGAGSIAGDNRGLRLTISATLDQISRELYSVIDGIVSSAEMAESGSSGPMFKRVPKTAPAVKESNEEMTARMDARLAVLREQIAAGTISQEDARLAISRLGEEVAAKMAEIQGGR